jgi:hypothetical protein
MGVLKGVLAKAPAPEKRNTRAEDEALIAWMLDRSQKAKAPEMLQPKNRWPSPQATKEEFNKRRDATLAFARETQEDLRGHAQGKNDGYQYLLILSAHSSRHTAQIAEVKANPNYPK